LHSSRAIVATSPELTSATATNRNSRDVVFELATAWTRPAGHVRVTPNAFGVPTGLWRVRLSAWQKTGWARDPRRDCGIRCTPWRFPCQLLAHQLKLIREAGLDLAGAIKLSAELVQARKVTAEHRQLPGEQEPPGGAVGASAGQQVERHRWPRQTVQTPSWCALA
jgi:hypothetical protein